MGSALLTPTTTEDPPEHQPLLVEPPSTNGEASTTAVAVGDATNDNDATTTSTTPTTTLAVTAAFGLTDGFTDWSHSLEAFSVFFAHSFVYLAVGIIAFSFVLMHWPVVDSLYFAVVLFSTVGYGDLHPTTAWAQLFTIFYAIYGIVVLGIFLGILADMILERQQEKKDDRMAEARRKYLNKFEQRLEGEATFSEHGTTSWLSSNSDFLRHTWIVLRRQALSIVILVLLAVPVIILEQWDVIKGLYWMVITATTIGLGDETPVHAWSKALCILYIPLAVSVAGGFLGAIASSYVDQRNDALEEKFMKRAMTLSDLRKMDTDSDGMVSEAEFLSYMLVTLQKVDPEDVDELRTLFRTLDKTRTGFINEEDIAPGFQQAATP